MRIRPMERNFIHSASRFLYHTHFYFNILSLTAKISARWLHCHEHPSCCSIVSCSPLILIGAHFSSHAIYQLHDLSLFKNMMKKRPCSEITAFKNSDPEQKGNFICRLFQQSQSRVDVSAWLKILLNKKKFDPQLRRVIFILCRPFAVDPWLCCTHYL
jgi:hypothetical protein